MRITNTGPMDPAGRQWYKKCVVVLRLILFFFPSASRQVYAVCIANSLTFTFLAKKNKQTKTLEVRRNLRITAHLRLVVVVVGVGRVVGALDREIT